MFVVRPLLMGVFTVTRMELVAVLVLMLVVAVMAMPMVMDMLMGMDMDMGVLVGVRGPVSMGMLMDMAVNMFMVVLMGFALVVVMGVDMHLELIGCHTSAGFTHSSLLRLDFLTGHTMRCLLEQTYRQTSSNFSVSTGATRVNSAKIKTLCHWIH